jgi:pullulanase/glycogen debranching enzyme
MSTRVVTSGASAPLGATVRDGGVNFSVFSKSAILVELLLFDDANATQPARVIPLDADKHRTYHYVSAVIRATQGRVMVIAAAASRGVGNSSQAVIVGRISLEAAPPSTCHDHAETVSILVNSRKGL